MKMLHQILFWGISSKQYIPIAPIFIVNKYGKNYLSDSDWHFFISYISFSHTQKKHF